MENKDFELKDRKKDLLLSSVEDYIENALPITSQKMHTNNFCFVSPATLRNELNALEEMGYLKKLHTSGGRIPTTKAYRFFVNWLITNNSLNMEEVDNIRDKFIERSAFLQDILTDLAKTISEITNYPTVVSTGGYSNLILQGVNVIPLMTGQALVLIKTDAGIINNTVKLKKSLSEENCKDASKFLTTSFYGKKISDVVTNITMYTEMFKTQIAYYQELFETLVQVLKEYAHQVSLVKSDNPQLILNSTKPGDIESAKKLMNILENEEDIKKVLDNIDSISPNDVTFAIGEETDRDDLSDFSIVKANYQLSNGMVTSIGVIGPKRLDYAKIASALKYIIEEQNKKNEEGKDNGKE